MNCQEICERLDGFVDGELTEAELQEVELHLAQCSTCREEARALRTLVAEAAALPRELAPSRDLWPAIALQVESPRRPAGDKRHARAWVWGGLAAAAALFLAALLWRSGEWQGVPAASPQDGVARPVTFEAERDYDRAAAELLSALEAQRAALTPETRARVDENLHAIAQALAAIRAELEKDPGNPDLNHLLLSVHQRRIEALRTLVRLTA